LVNGDSVTLSIGYSSGSAPVNVGKYTATCTSSGNANYQTATAETAIVITPATLTITAKNQSMTFGGATPTFAADFAGLMGTDTSAVVSGLSFITYTDNGLGTSVSNYQTLKVGPYPIVPGGGTAANYIIQYVNGSLTVNKATLTGSVIISPADPQTVPYGKPATATVYLNSYSIGGVDVLQAHNDPSDPNNPNNPLPPSVTLYLVPANGGPAQALKFGTATAVPTFDNTTNTSGTTKTGWAISITGNAPVPGQYNAVVYGDDPGDNSLSTLNLADAGYFFADTGDISYPTLSSNVLTVVPANLTITANSISKTYGETITFAGTEFTASGLVSSDKVTSVTLSSTGASVTAGVVGSPYAIVASAAVGTGLSNYTISYVDGLLTVNPAALTITANNATKTYGQALSFAGTEFTHSSLLNNDTVSSVTLTSLGAAATAGVTATPYAIVPSQAVGTGLSNYTISYVNGSLSVNQATPTIIWPTPAAITYGTALSGTQLNASASYLSAGTQATVAGTFTYTPAAGTVLNAGTQTLQVHFVPTDTTDFNPAESSVTLTVNKATPTINWATPAAITYGTALNPTQLDAAASYVSAGTQTAVAGAFTYTPAAGTVLNAGTQTLQVHFAPTDTSNFNAADGSVSLTVNKATPTINWPTPDAITYGTPLSAAQLDAAASYLTAGNQTAVAGVFTYTPAAGTVLSAGTQTLQVHFAPTDTSNFNAADGSVSLTVNKATPLINWAAPAAITYGTPLGTTQLDAAASYLNAGTQTAVAGTFTYTPAAGTILSAGNQTLQVHFVPADTYNFNPADGSVSLTVNKATPTINWATPVPVTYGTPLGTAQLNGTASYVNSGTQTSVVGVFTYTPAAGTVLSAGNQTLQVHFAPTDTSNFNPVDGSVPVLVNKATLLVTANNQSMTYGDPLSAYTYTITGFVNSDTQATAVTGVPSLTTSPVQPVNAGTYAITAAQGSLGASNYLFTFAPGTLTINKANASVTPNPSTKVYGTADPTLTGSRTGFLSADNVTATYSRTPGETATGGPYTISAALSPAAVLSNYNITYDTASFTITQASASVTPNAASKAYGTADPALTGTLTGFLAGDNVTATYSRAAGETVSGGPYAITAVLSPTSVLSN
jgi:hypothetical protein